MILMKFFLVILGLLVVSLILELVRINCGVPVTLMDFIFLLMIFFMCFFMVRSFFIRGEKKNYAAGMSSKKLLKSLFIFSFVAIPFGVWSVWGVWTGKVGAFYYFSGGGRGAVHGYTLISLGFLFLIMWVCAFIKIIRKVIIDKWHMKN